jgi:hypothetical protein
MANEQRGMHAKECCASVDRVFDNLLARLGCRDGGDADLISHWQAGANPGFRIQVTRRSDNRQLTKFVSQNGSVSA